MLTVLAICALTSLSCTDEELMAPRTEQPVVSANTLIVADTLCVRAQFTITSATAVTTLFPNRTSCTTNLVLIRGQAATWAQSPNRRLRLFVRLLNKSGQTLQMPVRLYLPPTGTTVVAPSGTPASKVVALLADSTDAAGGKIWFIGGTGTLAANDSTVQDTIKVNVMSPVTQARFQFQATASTVNAVVPPQAPDTIPAWVYAPGNISAGSTLLPTQFVKGIVVVLFRGTATQAERQAAIDLVGGTVVGGRNGFENGFYFVQVADPGDGSVLLQVSDQLETLPQVRSASPEFFVSQNYLRPKDGPEWRTWNLNPSSPDSSNWAMEAVNAPLGWGCSTGDSAAAVAVIDVGFHDLGEYMDNATLVSGPFQTGTGDHGTRVAALVGARGNNDALMAGMMWNANLQLYDYKGGGVVVPDPLSAAFNLAAKAALDGAMAINMSLGINWSSDRPDSTHPGQIKIADNVRKEFSETVADLAAKSPSRRPLYILSAGQTVGGGLGVNAWWNGTVAAKNATNEDIILVVAASDRLGALWPASYNGALVDIAAPGVGVYSLNGTGTIDSASGTSFSAPLATGLAGLLLSFDPRLQASELKQLIVAGAVAGGRSAGGFPILDAYESLKLAAERPGAPLCGNRIWNASTGAYVERSPGVDEPLTSSGGSYASIKSYHGGKFLELATPYGWQNGSWNSTALPPGLTVSGSYQSSLGMSHDGDSVAYLTQAYNPHVVSVAIRGAPPSDIPRTLTTFSGTIGGGNVAGGTQAVYPPVGAEVLVAISPGGDDSPLVEVSGVNMVTGAKRHIFDLPDVLYPRSQGGAVWQAFSEDGKQLIVNYAIKSTPVQLCKTEFRLVSDGSITRPTVTTPCWDTWGGFSTVRRTVSR